MDFELGQLRFRVILGARREEISIITRQNNEHTIRKRINMRDNAKQVRLKRDTEL